MTAEEWIASFAAALGTEAPDERTVGQLLDLAATAAHSSERIAAPLACYLAGRDGRPIAELNELADGMGGD
jgi:hypothetical protein